MGLGILGKNRGSLFVEVGELPQDEEILVAVSPAVDVPARAGLEGVGSQTSVQPCADYASWFPQVYAVPVPQRRSDPGARSSGLS